MKPEVTRNRHKYQTLRAVKHLKWCFALLFLGFSHFSMAQVAPVSQPELIEKKPAALQVPAPKTLTLALDEATMVWRASMAQALFYRPASDTLTSPIRVHVASGYHASLLPGSFAELCVAAGPKRIGAGFALAQASTSDVDLLIKTTHFFRLSQAEGQGVLIQEVTREKALQEAAGAEAVGMRSRVPNAQNCRNAS